MVTSHTSLSSTRRVCSSEKWTSARSMPSTYRDKRPIFSIVLVRKRSETSVCRLLTVISTRRPPFMVGGDRRLCGENRLGHRGRSAQPVAHETADHAERELVGRRPDIGAEAGPSGDDAIGADRHEI